MHRYWMETPHLAPLHYLDPSLPLRSLGRRYVQNKPSLINNEFKAELITQNGVFLAGGLKNNIIEQQINRHLLWAEPNISIFVLLNQIIFFFQFDVKRSVNLGHWRGKAIKGYLNKVTKSMLQSMQVARDDTAHFPLLMQSSVFAFVC